KCGWYLHKIKTRELKLPSNDASKVVELLKAGDTEAVEKATTMYWKSHDPRTTAVSFKVFGCQRCETESGPSRLLQASSRLLGVLTAEFDDLSVPEYLFVLQHLSHSLMAEFIQEVVKDRSS